MPVMYQMFQDHAALHLNRLLARRAAPRFPRRIRLISDIVKGGWQTHDASSLITAATPIPPARVYQILTGTRRRICPFGVHALMGSRVVPGRISSRRWGCSRSPRTGHGRVVAGGEGEAAAFVLFFRFGSRGAEIARRLPANTHALVEGAPTGSLRECRSNWSKL